jgi:hypothetical protein
MARAHPVMAHRSHEEPVQRRIFGRIQQNRTSGQAITSGAARFLVIGSSVPGTAMQHEAHVRPIDAHAERISGDHDR